jgi:DNA helicase HerA-like ATPase
VPEVNSIVLKAKTDHITVPEIKYPEYPLGIIPKTSLPVILNLKDSVSHHLAILGVTGSGKSFITHEIIKALLTDTKVICVDFTGEYITKLKDLDPKPILHDKAGLATIEELIAQKEDEARKSRDKGSALILDLKKKISGQLNTYIEEFLKSDGKVGIFELPDLSNTSFILEFTQFFFEDIFLYAKKNIGGPQICLVLEEAHTIVPETTFLGDLGDYGSTKAIVNKIGQIALQGRKYGIGLIVIAQRTANVSKTVLTQCNTTICFQAFDETSFTFLGNYVGKNLVTALPNLPKYHAIVSGKGAKSNIPVIVDLTRTAKE